MTLEQLTKTHERAEKLFRQELAKRTEMEAEIGRLGSRLDEAIRNADEAVIDLQTQKKRLEIQLNAQARRVAEARIIERQALIEISRAQQADFDTAVKEAQAAVEAAQERLADVIDNAPARISWLENEIHDLQRNALPRLRMEMQALAKGL